MKYPHWNGLYLICSIFYHFWDEIMDTLCVSLLKLKSHENHLRQVLKRLAEILEAP